MPILFFDTETTGKKNDKAPPEDPSQPDIVQLGAILTDDAFGELAVVNAIVYPTYWTIPEEVSRIHGITHAMAEEKGSALPDVFATFLALASVATRFVAHNADFDTVVIRRAAARLEIAADPFGGKEIRCTMRASKPILQLPNRNPYINDPWKFPKLEEVHRHYFGTGIENAHDAIADVRATIPVYRELCKHYGMEP